MSEKSFFERVSEALWQNKGGIHEQRGDTLRIVKEADAKIADLKAELAPLKAGTSVMIRADVYARMQRQAKRIEELEGHEGDYAKLCESLFQAHDPQLTFVDIHQALALIVEKRDEAMKMIAEISGFLDGGDTTSIADMHGDINELIEGTTQPQSPWLPASSFSSEEREALLKLAAQVQHEHETLRDQHITKNPCFNVIETDRVYGIDSEYGEDYVWASDGEYYTDEQFLEMVNGHREADELEPAEEITDELITEWNAEKLYYQDTEKQVGAFLTRKAAQRHIDANNYHYFNPRIYVSSFWRNPEMKLIRDFLLSVEVPTPAPAENEKEDLEG